MCFDMLLVDKQTSKQADRHYLFKVGKERLSMENKFPCLLVYY